MIPEKRVRGGKTRKRREGKAEKDPNAPKRPANPFFQFCQEQRPLVLDSMISSGNREPSKQDLTKQLAANWNVLSRKDKKVYTFVELVNLSFRSSFEELISVAKSIPFFEKFINIGACSNSLNEMS